MTDLFEQAIKDQLQAIAQDPKAQMDAQPQKYDRSGTRAITGATLFKPEDVTAKQHIGAGDPFRQRLIQAVPPDLALIRSNDRAEDLVDEFQHGSLTAMDRAGLGRSNLPVAPWSDDYWALYLGVLGRRYADPDFPESSDWKENYDYIASNRAAGILSSGDADAIDRLSPAEKYDILVGDPEFTLTRQMWDEGRRYYDEYGHVESWMGICHGWAPVAYMLERPTSAVRVIAADGTPLVFYPSDIKALASLLWANVRTHSRFIGGRCNDKDPKQDPQTGRMVSSECFDTNPGAWHLAVVNQIGVSQRSFIIDATFDYEVWNQPILSYEYRYFNPQTMQSSDSLDGALVPIGDFDNDRFADYRSSATATVAGIAMDVAYMVETRPSHNQTDSHANDDMNHVRYVYDIEQDAMGGIIGGEWYTNLHPDFLWTPPENERAVTDNASATGPWRRNQPLPPAWRAIGRQVSARHKAPSASIVEHLIGFANT